LQWHSAHTLLFVISHNFGKKEINNLFHNLGVLGVLVVNLSYF